MLNLNKKEDSAKAVYERNTLNVDVEIKYRVETEAIIRKQIMKQSIPRGECRQ